MVVSAPLNDQNKSRNDRKNSRFGSAQRPEQE